MAGDPYKKQEAKAALIKIIVLDAALVVAAAAAYLYTGRLMFLIGGVIGASLITTPMVFRWMRDQAPARGDRRE